MERRRLGRSDLHIAPLMLGGNVFGWTADEATSFAILDAFVDAGFNAVDTADVYARWVPDGVGLSERVIGAWIKASGKRDKVMLATKVGMDLGEGRKGLTAKYIAEGVEASLKRLQTDYIDLYQAHADDPEVPQEETLEAFARLIEQGKVRAIGASNFTAERLQSALDTSARLGLPRYETLQPLYNLSDRAPFEDALQGLCVREGLGAIPYYSLAVGFLTGKYRGEADFGQSRRGQGARRYFNARGLRILEGLDATAALHGATPAQAALAWAMARPAVAAPIASATSLTQLDELMGAARLSLTPQDMARLEAASAADPVAA